MILFLNCISAEVLYAQSETPASVSSSSASASSLSAEIVEKVPLNPQRLWLPASYRQHSASLLKAAASALAMPRCREVKKGTLDLSQSTAEIPVFRFLCLQENGKTYTEVIEGDKFTSLLFEPTKTPECYENLLKQIQLMKDFVWVPNSHALTTDQLARWEFDATSVDGLPLRYQAVCVLGNNGGVKVKLSPRE